GQELVRRSAALRLRAARANRIPGPRPRLPGPVRPGAGDELGGASSDGHCRPHLVAEAGSEAVRDEDDSLLAGKVGEVGENCESERIRTESEFYPTVASLLYLK